MKLTRIHKTSAVGQSWGCRLVDVHARARMGGAELQSEQAQNVGLTSVRQQRYQPTASKAANADACSYQTVAPGCPLNLIAQLISEETATDSRSEPDQARYVAVVAHRFTDQVISRCVGFATGIFVI